VTAMNSDDMPSRLSRREMIKWFMAASAVMTAGNWPQLHAAETVTDAPKSKGYGTDPDLMKFYQPGDLWPLTFDEKQRAIVKALADLILPADHLGPAASALGVPEFVDEWISAPYPDQIADRPVILDGLKWIEGEAQKRFGMGFAALPAEKQTAICDDIAYEPKAKEEFKTGAAFFATFRGLSAAGYYSTPEGWKAIGYVGNVALASFEGPPPEVLKQLGLEGEAGSGVATVR